MDGALRLLPFTVIGLSLSAIIMHISLLRNIHRGRSGVLSLYWVIVVAFDVVKARTLTVTDVDTAEPARYSFFIIQFALTFALLLFEQVPLLPIEDSTANPEFYVSPASFLSFSWISPIMRKAYKGKLEFADIWPAPSFVSPIENYGAFSKHWANELKKPKPSLALALAKSFGYACLFPIFCTLAGSTLLYFQPSLLNPLLTFINSYSKDANGHYLYTPQPLSQGMIIAVGLFVLSALASIFNAWFFKLMCNFGFSLRNALICAIYRKSLRLSPASRQTATAGEITNRMSVDAEQFFWASQSLGFTISTFYQIALALYFLYAQLSWAIFAGLGIILLMFPFNYWIGVSFNKTMKGKMNNMDKRMRLMNEIISGIKIVKLYAWENSFFKRVTEVRETEVRFVQKFGEGAAWITVIFTVAPYLVSIACFGVYGGAIADKDHPLDSVRIFVSLSLIQLLNGPLGMLCKCIIIAS